MRKKKEEKVLSEENIAERIFLMNKIIDVFKIFNETKKVKLKQFEIAKILGTNQPRVSCLFNPNGNYMFFSTELLKDYLKKIGYEITLKKNLYNKIHLTTKDNSKKVIIEALKKIRSV